MATQPRVLLSVLFFSALLLDSTFARVSDAQISADFEKSAETKTALSQQQHVASPNTKSLKKLAVSKAIHSLHKGNIAKLEEESGEGGLFIAALVCGVIAIVGLIIMVIGIVKHNKEADNLLEIFTRNDGCTKSRDYNTFVTTLKQKTADKEAAEKCNCVGTYGSQKTICKSNCDNQVTTTTKLLEEYKWSFNGPWLNDQDKKDYEELKGNTADEKMMTAGACVFAIFGFACIVLLILGFISSSSSSGNGVITGFALGSLLASCFGHKQSVAVLREGYGYDVVRVEDLRVEDRVLAADAEHQTPQWSRVYFADCLPATLQKVLEIHVEGHSLQMTEDHLILRVSTDGTNYVHAKDLHVGDLVLTAFDGETETSTRPIDAISVSQDSGICEIKTESGTLIADGIVASVSSTAHFSSKAAWLPIRVLSKILPASVYQHPSLIRTIHSASDLITLIGPKQISLASLKTNGVSHLEL